MELRAGERNEERAGEEAEVLGHRMTDVAQAERVERTKRRPDCEARSKVDLSWRYVDLGRSPEIMGDCDAP